MILTTNIQPFDLIVLTNIKPHSEYRSMKPSGSIFMVIDITSRTHFLNQADCLFLGDLRGGTYNYAAKYERMYFPTIWTSKMKNVVEVATDYVHVVYSEKGTFNLLEAHPLIFFTWIIANNYLFNKWILAGHLKHLLTNNYPLFSSLVKDINNNNIEKEKLQKYLSIESRQKICDMIHMIRSFAYPFEYSEYNKSLRESLKQEKWIDDSDINIVKNLLAQPNTTLKDFQNMLPRAEEKDVLQEYKNFSRSFFNK